MLSRWRGFLANDAGNVAVIFALSLVLIIGVGSIVLDIGHAIVVKREMQNACDAGAGAGATALFLNADGTPRTDPDWANALTAAVNAVQRNIVDKGLLSSFTSANVERGYWDSSWAHGIPQSPPANGHLLGYTSPATYVPSSVAPWQYPAVKVTLAKAAGGTGTSAPLTTYLASIWGVNSMEVRSSAVASRYYPKTISNGFPGAVPKSMFHQVNGVWQPLPQYMPPNTFNISNTSTDPGQWTTYGAATNGTSDIDLLITGHSATVSTGDQIWIPNGVHSAVYNAIVDNCIYSDNNPKIFMIPVAEVPGSTSLTTGNWATVDGFVAIKITACTGSGSGGNPYYTCEFVPGYVDSQASGAGAPVGAPLATKLVQ